MRFLAVGLAAAALAVGCGRLRLPPHSGTDATRLVRQADELARNDAPHDARRIYRQVLHDHPGTPAAERALYGLAQLYIDPNGKLKDYSFAYVAFSRLLNEYPDSVHAQEARAWHAVLTELLRNQTDARRLRGDLDRLKELDMEEEGEQ